MGYKVSVKQSFLMPTKEEIESFLKAIPKLKEQHIKIVRDKLEFPGEYYIIYANKT